MTGLRHYARDARLPSLAGDPHAVPPREREIVDLVQEHLVEAGAPRPLAATWEYARWKPHVASAAVHRVTFEDGSEHLVTWKRREHAKPHPDESVSARRGLRGAARVGDAELTVFPCDRELRGAARALDVQRACRHLAASESFAGSNLRWRRSSAHLVRYKPEHRAVVRLDLVERSSAGELETRSLGVRVHALATSARIVAARAACLAAQQLGPRVVAVEERTGSLFEEWLDADPHAPDDFSTAYEAGRCLATLHACAFGTRARTAASSPLALGSLFSVDPALHARARTLLERAWPAPVDAAWTHGDFHPDQVARSRRDGALRVLDWDELAVGDPCDDLASWIADAIAHGGAASFDAASSDLLTGYASGGRRLPDERRLRELTARALVHSAAGAIRRLEEGAVAKAAERLERALDLLAAAPTPHTPTPFEQGRAALASALGGPVHAAHVRRVEMRDDGSLLWTHESAGATRYFATEGATLEELDPRLETALPGVARWLGGDALEATRVLAWRPGRRMVLAARCAGVDVIVKCLRRGRSNALAAAHASIAAALPAEFVRVPRILAHDEALSTISFERIAGSELALSSTADTERAGSALRSLWNARIDAPLKVHDRAHELANLDRAALRFERALGALPRGFASARTRLERLEAPASPSYVLAHRDLHDGQFLFDAGGAVLLDLDLCARCEPELDAANFAVHLRLCGLQRVRGADERGARSAEEAFLASAGISEGTHAYGFYAAATSLRLALVFGIRPRWAELAPRLVEEAHGSLAEVSRA